MLSMFHDRALMPHVAGVAAIPDAERQPMVEHTVTAGETLSHIALASGVSVATLKRANRLSSSRLSVGQVIRIPAPGSAAFAEAPAPPAAVVAEHEVVARLFAEIERSGMLTIETRESGTPDPEFLDKLRSLGYVN